MNTRIISREDWQRIERIVAGECSEEDVRAIEESFSGNPAAQKAFLEYCQLHIDLLIDVRAETASKPLLEQVSQDPVAPGSLGVPGAVAELHTSAAPEVAHPLRTIGFAVSGWCVAAFAGLVALFLVLSGSPPAYKPPAAEQTASRRPLPLAGQSLRLDSGTAKLVLPGIGYVVLEGPVDFDLINEKRARLKTGRIKMRVTEESGRGFIVETPDGEITDLGTEFGVEVVNGRETGLVVFEGSVDLRVSETYPTQAAHVARLVGGEGALFNRGGPLTRINSIVTGNVATFVRNSDNPADFLTPQAADGSSALIVAVDDNLRSAETKKFYEIVPGGLREDAKAYADTKHEWNGVTAAGIPEYLVGADYVKTFNQLSVQSRLGVCVTLARPAKLYVFLDSRSTPPAWLEQEFRNTGDRIGLDAFRSRRFPKRVICVGPGEGIDDEFTIWERDIREPGKIRLGTNLGPTEIDPGPAMYGIAAVPLEVPVVPPLQTN